VFQDHSRKSHTATRGLAVVGAGALLLYGSRFLLNFFGPAVAYSMRKDVKYALDSEEFLRFLSLVTDGTIRNVRLTRLKNGSEFYPAELRAIKNARKTINMEFYEFSPGQVADSILDALTERARAGVEVRMIVDAIGSFQTHRSLFAPLVGLGGAMRFYHPISWKTWQHANHRTHRKLLVVDGEIGFIGGAGVADHWIKHTKTGPAWRDTVFQVEGEAVAGLTSTFAENWLEASGEILCSPEHFAYKSFPQAAKSFVVSSTPNDGGTRARVLFQALINSARHSILITTPYFLPDRSARQALIEAVRDRGVKVQILTAGPLIDHPAVRTLSRHSSRRLLEAGAEIHEYQPSMIHAKLLTVDGQWSVVGSTNFDHRSFALNDEVNLAIFDRDIAQTIAADFAEDLQQSRRLTLAMLDQRVVGDILRPITHALKQES
jgi:cardiolipin synthase